MPNLLSFMHSTKYLERILISLEDEINKCEQYIVHSKASKDEDYYDLVVDEECDMVEKLIGLSFVAVQVHINSVISSIERSERRAESKKDSFRSSGKKWEVFKFGSLSYGKTGFTKIEVINEMANYFKHESEWPRQWDIIEHSTRKQHKGRVKTIKVLKAIGCSEGSLGNFRTVVNGFQIKYNRLRQLVKIIQIWQNELFEIYK